uniref:Uncharacterized protein n=1 Tax=Panagrolaimus davidi TaxID=227884 RepID=A0A914QJ10_9BILA
MQQHLPLMIRLQSPPKEELRHSTTSQSNKMEEIRQMQQKLFHQQKEFRQKQEEIEEEEKAILRQPSDSKEEGLQHLHLHIVNPAYEMASPTPSPIPQRYRRPLLRQLFSTFPQKEIIELRLRQYVSEKMIILFDEEPYDCHLRLLQTRQFVVGGFATYFDAKEEFVIFKHASNDGDLCIGFRVPKENSTKENI